MLCSARSATSCSPFIRASEPRRCGPGAPPRRVPPIDVARRDDEPLVVGPKAAPDLRRDGRLHVRCPPLRLRRHRGADHAAHDQRAAYVDPAFIAQVGHGNVLEAWRNKQPTDERLEVARRHREEAPKQVRPNRAIVLLDLLRQPTCPPAVEAELPSPLAHEPGRIAATDGALELVVRLRIQGASRVLTRRREQAERPNPARDHGVVHRVPIGIQREHALGRVGQAERTRRRTRAPGGALRCGDVRIGGLHCSLAIAPASPFRAQRPGPIRANRLSPLRRATERLDAIVAAGPTLFVDHTPRSIARRPISSQRSGCPASTNTA